MFAINKSQLSILCEIAGINQLFGISFETHLMEVTKSVVIKELEKKSFIVNGALSNSGRLILSLLNEYANANEHYCLNNTYLAPYQENDDLFVSIKESDFDYIVDMISRDLLLLAIIGSNDDLLRVEDKKYQEMLKSENEIVSEISELGNTLCYVFKKFNCYKQEQINKLLYVNEGYLKIYDLKLSKLELIGRKDMQVTLEQLI